VDIDHLCAAIKEKVAAELRETTGSAARSEILIDALYETSRSVIPALGTPKKTIDYQKAQEAVLDLISSIAIPLIRGGGGRHHGVAVLSELAEGCPDPLLKKKLSVYAQELLAKTSADHGQGARPSGWRAAAPVASGAVTALVMYLVWPNGHPEIESRIAAAPPVTEKATATAAPAESLVVSRAAPPVTTVPHVPRPAVSRHGGGGDSAGGAADEAVVLPRQQEKPAATTGASAPRGEATTRVRILNSQVLVPVTLKHGGGSIRLELVLDTGSTRTVVHEGVAGRLPIDLGSARTAMAEVADGRMISTRIARIDSLSVGPFAHASMEVELIPYSGTSGMHDGLLGMDFLGKHRYQIDMEHALIRWF